MRSKPVFALILLLFFCGCVGQNQSTCRKVNKTYNATEVFIEAIPKNITVVDEGYEPYLVRENRTVPLTYQIVRGASISKRVFENGSDRWYEYGSLDQIVNGSVYVSLKNNDTVAGFFEVYLNVSKNNKSFVQSDGKTLASNQTGLFEFYFELVRGTDWVYHITVENSGREVEVRRLKEQYVNKTRVETVYDYVRREVDVVKTVEVDDCSVL